MQEFEKLSRSAPLPGVTVSMVNDDLNKWDVVIQGPDSTPFYGGKFKVQLDFLGYPFKPPKINFKTKIYHPNVKQDTGEICMQAIESAWAPTKDATFIVTAIITLIRSPNAENALEVDIANRY